MSASATNKLSFTIRRPSPVSRASSAGADSDFKVPALPRHLSGTNSGAGSPLGRGSPKPKSRTYEERDSSDEDEVLEDELVTGFDQFGVQRCVNSSLSEAAGPQLTVDLSVDRLHEKKKPQGPLVIPALKNKDWREQARKRKSLFIPPSAAATTGADGSVGGLGTRDTINSGPQFAGIQMKKRIKVDTEDETMQVEEEVQAISAAAATKEEETEDQKAIRALLAGANGDGGELDGPQIDIIPVVTEDDAYQQDVVELPDSATLDDYERVPVSQFGAALLRGMGWKEGTGASKTGKGPVQPYLPAARPALLGIGAKEKEVLDDGSKKKKGRPDKRYVPLIKKERREGDREYDSAPASGSSSRSRRRTPEPRSSRRSPSPERRRDRDRARHDSADGDRHRDGRDREKEQDRRRETDRDGGRGDRDRDRRRDDRDYREYDSGSRRERDRNGERTRDRSLDGSQGRRDRDRRDR